MNALASHLLAQVAPAGPGSWLWGGWPGMRSPAGKQVWSWQPHFLARGRGTGMFWGQELAWVRGCPPGAACLHFTPCLGGACCPPSLGHSGTLSPWSCPSQLVSRGQWRSQEVSLERTGWSNGLQFSPWKVSPRTPQWLPSLLTFSSSFHGGPGQGAGPPQLWIKQSCVDTNLG